MLPIPHLSQMPTPLLHILAMRPDRLEHELLGCPRFTAPSPEQLTPSNLARSQPNS